MRPPPAVAALIRKEFREYRHHRSILITALGLPLVFLFLPVIFLSSFDATATEADVKMAVGQAIFTFFLAPVIVPAAMAAYSVIASKWASPIYPFWKCRCAPACVCVTWKT